MSDKIRVYGIDMSDFGFEEAKRSFVHGEGCPVKSKDTYNAGDRLVGVAYQETTERDFLIYSCSKCGGMYAVEGRVPDKIAKGI